MIQNPTFEQGARKVILQQPSYWEGFVPVSWHPWFLVQGYVPHEPDDPSHEGYLPPECHVIERETPYLNPLRVHEGQYAFKMHSMWRIYEAGLYQVIDLSDMPDLFQVYMYAHAWSSNDDNPHTSEPLDNIGFSLGVDLTGDTSSQGWGVSWSPTKVVRDKFEKVLGPIIRNPGSGFATIYLRSSVLWRFKHLDSYLDSVGIDALQPDTCVGTPRVPYDRIYNVIPQNATFERATNIFQIGWERGRQTSGGSSDDAGMGDLQNKVAVEWDRPEAEWPEYRAFYDNHYSGARVRFEGTAQTPEPPTPPTPPPTPGWEPHNYVPRGTKLAIHGVGDGGQVDLLQQKAVIASGKNVQAIGAARDQRAINPDFVTIGRVLDVPEYGNVQGFDYNRDPIEQAHWHMGAILKAFADWLPYYSFIETGPNEQKPPTSKLHIQMARFYIECMHIANERNIKLALFSHSTGTPEPEDWDAIADTGVFELAAAGGHAISLHEYDIHGQGGHLYRYRYLYNNIILPRQLDIPLYITEFNTDVLFAKDHEVMWDLWMRYDSELSKDPYVAGAHIYSTGSLESRYKQTIYDLFPRLIQYSKEKADG